MSKHFLNPFVLQANFSPDGSSGGGSGAASPDTGVNGDAAPASLAAAAGIDPDKTPAPANSDAAGKEAGANDAGDGKEANADAGESKTPTDNADAAKKLYGPEGLPEEFRGKDDRETIDNLLAARPQLPSSEADYKYELTGETAKLVGQLEDNPILSVWRGVSKDLGLTNEQSSGAFDKFIGQLVDQKHLPAAVDFEEELKALAPSNEADPVKGRAAAVTRLQGTIDFVNGLKERKVFSDDEANMLYGLANSAVGVGMLEKLAGLGKGHGIQGGGAPAEKEEKTQAEIMYPTQNRN